MYIAQCGMRTQTQHKATQEKHCYRACYVFISAGSRCYNQCYRACCLSSAIDRDTDVGVAAASVKSHAISVQIVPPLNLAAYTSLYISPAQTNHQLIGKAFLVRSNHRHLLHGPMMPTKTVMLRRHPQLHADPHENSRIATDCLVRRLSLPSSSGYQP